MRTNEERGGILACTSDKHRLLGKVCLHLRYKDTTIYTRGRIKNLRKTPLEWIDLQTSRPIHARTPGPPRCEEHLLPIGEKKLTKATNTLSDPVSLIETVAFAPTEVQTHSGAPTCHFCFFSSSFLTWSRVCLTKPEQEDTKTKLAHKGKSGESEPEGHH